MQSQQEMIVIDALEHSNWERELFEELRSGGVTAVNVTCAIWEDSRATLENLGDWNQWFKQHDDIISRVDTAEDIKRCHENQKTGIILGFQNSSPFEDDIALVEIFHQLGVRIVQLTYNNQSLIGGSCYEDNDGGLTRYGKEVVDEMNRLGMLIDLSHVGEQTSSDVIEYSDRPVAMTHANPNAFYEATRNKSDEILRKLSENDGMLGLSIYPHHIGGADVSLDEFCSMVDHAVDLFGIDRVGFGTDASRKWSDDYLEWVRSGRWKSGVAYGEGSPDDASWPEWPEWFSSPADFPQLINGLEAHGYSDREVRKLMGENWLEFLEESFQPA